MIDVENMLDLNEKSSVDFLLSLRKRWADVVYPAFASEFEASGIEAATVEDAERSVKDLSIYPWFSHLERAQQKLLWKTVGDAVIRRREELASQLEREPEGSLGRLVLNDDMELPDWYTKYDIHIQPGSFYSDDLSAYVYELGARIVMLRDNDGYKFHQLFAETALPVVPVATRVLDIGCGFGKSTRPLVAKFPGAEVIGVDLAAPGLKLAHAEAEAQGIPITFIQAEGSKTGLESDSCDIVTGTMVLHEMPSSAIVDTIREAARVLKPGGELHFLEFMATGDIFRDATVHEHAERNNEPYFRDLFATDLISVAAEFGLSDARWTPFDERSEGLSPEGWGSRPEWHFPWGVFSAVKESV